MGGSGEDAGGEGQPVGKPPLRCVRSSRPGSKMKPLGDPSVDWLAEAGGEDLQSPMLSLTPS
eukprot:3292950-Pyramimonas_sp.AAC.1